MVDWKIINHGLGSSLRNNLPFILLDPVRWLFLFVVQMDCLDRLRSVHLSDRLWSLSARLSVSTAISWVVKRLLSQRTVTAAASASVARVVTLSASWSTWLLLNLKADLPFHKSELRPYFLKGLNKLTSAWKTSLLFFLLAELVHYSDSLQNLLTKSLKQNIRLKRLGNLL